MSFNRRKGQGCHTNTILYRNYWQNQHGSILDITLNEANQTQETQIYGDIGQKSGNLQASHDQEEAPAYFWSAGIVSWCGGWLHTCVYVKMNQTAPRSCVYFTVDKLYLKKIKYC